jgi:hypothetical protein
MELFFSRIVTGFIPVRSPDGTFIPEKVRKLKRFEPVLMSQF